MNLGVELNAAEARSAPGRQTSGIGHCFLPVASSADYELFLIPESSRSPLGRSHVRVMSVIHLKADNHQRGLHVRFVPLADIDAENAVRP
jgi:hypothetical protein